MPRYRYRIAFASSFVRPALAFVAFALSTAGLLALREALTGPVIALLYLLLVVVSTVVWGLGPGVLVAVGAFLAFNFFFIPPYYTFTVHEAADVLALIVFLIVAVVISQLLGRVQASAAAALSREQEATRLYELSTALAGLQDDRAIADTLAERVHDAFHATHAEVHVTSQPDVPALRRGWPAHAPTPARPADRTVPLLTARGLLGELRVWRNGRSFSPSDERLLRVFASQGAVALERARLAQAEKRAEIFEESDRLKTALLSSVSHELRTPLATIKAAVTSLRGDEVHRDSPAGDDLLAAVEEEVDLLNRLVGNLLDMSRIEAGALKPQRQWDILADIIADVTRHMRRVAEQHQLKIDVPDDLPLIPVDHAQMEQVFINLIGNSIKYAPPGSVICVLARVQDDQSLLAQVINQGPPVAEEHLPHIFEKFYRVNPADRITGAGLGLSICKGILEAHGGRIWAENRPGGFAFNFTLPRAWDGAPPPRLPVEAESI